MAKRFTGIALEAGALQNKISELNLFIDVILISSKSELLKIYLFIMCGRVSIFL